jgi:hypothetical protein
MVPGSVATQQETITQDFGGALRLVVDLLCANCGSREHGWDGKKCPVARSDPAVCSRPFPQILAIPAGPLHAKRRRIAASADTLPQPPQREAVSWEKGDEMKVLLRLWEDTGARAEQVSVAELESAAAAASKPAVAAASAAPVLKLENGGSQQLSSSGGTAAAAAAIDGGGWVAVAGEPASLLPDGRPVQVVAVSVGDGSARVRWEDGGDGHGAGGSWVDTGRLRPP